MNSILDAARELCAEYLGGAWSTIDNTQIVLKKLSGGLTNLVFLCELSPDVVTLMCEPRSVLLRIQTQSDSLQLMREIAVFISLSAHGYGPPNLLACSLWSMKSYPTSNSSQRRSILGESNNTCMLIDQPSFLIFNQ
ncbi:hypothetical protein COOONC_14492, partial [Cooperia oncophora]